MSFIDSTYFKADLLIVNINAEGNVGEALRKDLDDFIQLKERDYLIWLLGKDFYTLFIDGLEENEVAEKWTNLKDKLIDEDLLTSPIAKFVYYYYMVNRMRFNNSDQVQLIPNEILYRIYNDMVNESKEIWAWILDNTAIYPEYKEFVFMFDYINCFGI